MFPQQPTRPVRVNGIDNTPSFSSTRQSTPMSASDSAQGSEPSSSDHDTPNRRSFMRRGGFYNPRSQRDQDWEQWTHLKVKLSNFPTKPSTGEVHRLAATYGVVTSIDIDDSYDAYIVFCPPPRVPIWKRNIQYLTPDGAKRPIRVTLIGKAFDRMVQSSVKARVYYPEYTVLPLGELQFGFMHSETAMMVMKSVVPPPDTRAEFRLDLHRRELDIRFPLAVPSGPSQDETEIAMFRFQVPLPKVSAIHIEESESGQIAMILPLSGPPEFYRQTKDMQATHNPRDSRWYERLAWFRQTDVVNDLVKLETKPVSLSKEDAIVDIGRWTTYRMILNHSQLMHGQFPQICQALKDYNVKLVTNEIALIPRADIPIWRLLDGPGKPTGNPSNLLFQLSNSVKQLSFEVRYQLEVCMSHGYLHESNITEEFLQKLAQLDESIAVGILEKVADTTQRFFDPMSIFELTVRRSTAKKKIPAHCTLARSAVVTPTMIYYTTPSVEISNRVVRHWSPLADHFIRVRFSDELDNGRVQSQDNKIVDEVFARITRAMENGIVLGDRKYEYLASGNSQFRENGAYFFAPTPEWPTQLLRDHLGQMDPNDQTIPAKFCARIGQNFSTTRGISSKVLVRDVCGDIERNGFNFTDGVGKISPHLARLIAEEFGLSTEDPPSVYQFRLGGCKGVLAIAPDVPGNEVHIRPSQAKFAAIHEGLEIIRTSSYVTAFLNRQIIVVLSTLGVPDEIFRLKLHNQLEDLTRAMVDEQVALRELQKSIDFNQMTLTLAGMIMDGFMRVKDPFMMSMLNLWRSWSVKYLKQKAKVTIEQGACLLGCVDETGELKGHFNSAQPPEDASMEEKINALPEIFCYVDRKRTGIYEPIEGICVMARNPSLHPGDIRVVRAVDNPNLHHLRNVVVLPQTGDRDLGNMCSGGDLDGDDYWIIWDQDLIPEEWNHPAMDFTPVRPRRVRIGVTVKDMIEFFVNYMQNDNLGVIAHAHLAAADREEFGVKSDKCLALAQLHSQAVDFNKSGVPAKMTRDLRPRGWPHFMEKRHSKSQYHSEKILGQLCDMVTLIDFVPDYAAPFDQRVLHAHDVSEEMLQQAADIKEQYDTDFRRIMAQHDIDTEFEVWSTFVMSHNGERRDYAFAEELGQIVASVKGKYREMCMKAAGGDFFDTLPLFVTAMYNVTERQVKEALEECKKTKLVGGMEVPLRTMDSKGMPLMSFPWLFDRELGKIASGNFYSRKSIERQQGTQKRSTKRAPVSGLDTAETIETSDGVVPKGELIDFFQTDKDGDYAVPAPILLEEDVEQARRIKVAIEGRCDDSEYIKKPARPTKEIPDNYENLLADEIESDDDEEEEPLTPSEGGESSSSLGSKDADPTGEDGDDLNRLVEVNLNLGPKTSAFSKLAALMGEDSDDE